MEPIPLLQEIADSGGSGANFLVEWSGPSEVRELLTETVMTGHVGDGYLSFTSRGVELRAKSTELGAEAAPE